MDRCTQTLADKCVAALAALTEVSALVSHDKLNYNASFKNLVLSDPFISVEIDSPSSFSVFQLEGGMISSNSSAIASARVSDFLMGAIRVKRQYEDLEKMKLAGTGAAWLLVSSYYCAFYACIEISKLFDRIPMSFENDDLKMLSYKATGADHAAFFELKNNNFVGHLRAGKIVFQSIGAKPHALAWDNILIALKKVFEKKEWLEANKYQLLLSEAEYSPSKIRNTWNYKRSDYYGQYGDSFGAEFRKLIGNPSGAQAWLARRAPHIQALDPCIVIVLCEFLSVAVINAAQRTNIILQQRSTS
jgi:hypothetical protein